MNSPPVNHSPHFHPNSSPVVSSAQENRRRLSGSSNNTQRTQGLIPETATEFYLKRFQGWTNLVRTLIQFFEAVIGKEKKMSEMQLKMAKDMRDTLSSSQMSHFFDDQETFQILYSSLIETQMKEAQDHASSAEMIETQILPILKSLLIEVQKKSKDADKEWLQMDKEMAKDRDLYIKLVSNLRIALMRHQWRGDAMGTHDPTTKEIPKDPWLVDLSIKRHASNCFSKQAEYRQALDEQKRLCASFETIIYQNLKVALSLYFDLKSKSQNTAMDLLKTLKPGLSQIDAEADWSKFIGSSPEIFFQSSAPIVRIENLTYDGFDDPLTKVIEQGSLMKKESGMFSSVWKTYKVVLTGAGFFHMITTNVEGDSQFTTPELSLDLSECTVGPLMLNDKEPEEFTLSEKPSGIFGREVKHKVKGKDMEVSAKWWGLLSDYVRSIKKSIAVASQIAMDESGTNLPENTSDEHMRKVLQKPLQPSPRISPVSPSPPLPSRQNYRTDHSGHSPKLPPRNKQTNEYGSTAAPVYADSRPLSAAPLPPRRTPLAQSSYVNPQAQSNAISNEKTQEMPVYQNLDSIVQETSEGFSTTDKSDVPLALQMEMALQAAVKERKPPSLGNNVENPWGDDDNNVWS